MVVEVAILISLASLGFSIYQGVTGMKRNQKQDVQGETTQLTTVIVKLETIGNGISEIKQELNSMKNDMKADHDIIMRVQESVKSAWKRIETIEAMLNGGGGK